MKERKVCKRTKRREFQYNKGDIQVAIAEVKLGKPLRQNLSYSRASVTGAELSGWFAKSYLEENNVLNLSSKRVFNGDESDFKLAPYKVLLVIIRSKLHHCFRIMPMAIRHRLWYFLATKDFLHLLLTNFQKAGA